MTAFGNITNSDTAEVVFIESAQADDLQLRVNAALGVIYGADPVRTVASLSLAGGGDGHTFVAQITSAEATDVDGGLPNGSGVLCYLASTNDALTEVRAGLVATISGFPLGDEQIAGAAKGTRFMGLIVLGTPTPVTPPASVTSFGSFFALMPGDNASTIAVGAPMLFPQDGPTDGTIVRSSSSAFVLPAAGTYEVFWQVSVTEAGQLQLEVDGSAVPSTVAGRATGTSQIVNRVLITTTDANQVLRVINPAGNAAALTITPDAGGTHAVSAWLVIKRLA